MTRTEGTDGKGQIIIIMKGKSTGFGELIEHWAEKYGANIIPNVWTSVIGSWKVPWAEVGKTLFSTE